MIFMFFPRSFYQLIVKKDSRIRGIDGKDKGVRSQEPFDFAQGRGLVERSEFRILKREC
jgi:hypothetical protein